MQGLLTSHYPGKIYPVNHHSSKVYGIRAYPDIKSISDSVELAVLTIPEASVERVVQDCCEKKVKGITKTNEPRKHRKVPDGHHPEKHPGDPL